MAGDETVRAFVLGAGFATLLIMLGRAMDLELARLAVADQVVHLVVGGAQGAAPERADEESDGGSTESGEWVPEGSDLT